MDEPAIGNSRGDISDTDRSERLKRRDDEADKGLEGKEPFQSDEAISSPDRG